MQTETFEKMVNCISEIKKNDLNQYHYLLGIAEGLIMSQRKDDESVRSSKKST